MGAIKGININKAKLIEAIYWYLLFGKSKRKISPDEIKTDLEKIPAPVFFLSTGRCGTKWFADLLSQDKDIVALHAPLPDYGIENCYAYSVQKKDPLMKDKMLFDALKHIFLTGREQHLRYSYKTNKRYFETNNHLTFFAPIISSILPQSKFVHIVRHPLEFIKSGMNRKWYTEESSASRQISPVNYIEREQWDKWPREIKIAWLWNETNTFIEHFKNQVDEDRCFTFNFNDLNSESLLKVNDFLDINITKRNISKRLGKKVNAGKNVKNYNMDNQRIIEIRKICSQATDTYGYKL